MYGIESASASATVIELVRPALAPQNATATENATGRGMAGAMCVEAQGTVNVSATVIATAIGTVDVSASASATGTATVAAGASGRPSPSTTRPTTSHRTTTCGRASAGAARLRSRRAWR